MQVREFLPIGSLSVVWSSLSFGSFSWYWPKHWHDVQNYWHTFVLGLSLPIAPASCSLTLAYSCQITWATLESPELPSSSVLSVFPYVPHQDNGTQSFHILQGWWDLYPSRLCLAIHFLLLCWPMKIKVHTIIKAVISSPYSHLILEHGGGGICTKAKSAANAVIPYPEPVFPHDGERHHARGQTEHERMELYFPNE